MLHGDWEIARRGLRGFATLHVGRIKRHVRAAIVRSIMYCELRGLIQTS